MTRLLHPPERDRHPWSNDFDPVAEGARYRLPPELSMAIWERVCAEATDSAGRRDEEQAQRRFHKIAASLAARGGRLRPDVGRLTRVGAERDGVSMAASIADELIVRAPGRETLIEKEARRWTEIDAKVGAEPAITRPPSEQPGASDVAQAIAALLDSTSVRLPDRAEGNHRGMDAALPGGEVIWSRPKGESERRRDPGVLLFAAGAVRAAPTVVGGAERGPAVPAAHPRGSTSALFGRPTAHPEGAEAPSARLAARAQAGRSQAASRELLEQVYAIAAHSDQGAPLPRELVARMKAEVGGEDVAAGQALEQVRIHTDDAAAEAAQLLGAQAFTLGQHVYFGRDEFAPGTDRGDRLLRHELTHVAQHARGELAAHGTLELVAESSAPEAEARAAEARLSLPSQAPQTASTDVRRGTATAERHVVPTAAAEPSVAPSPNAPMEPEDDLGGDTDELHAAAKRGTEGAGAALPHGDRIQRVFGRHDISQIRAFVGGAAREASEAIGAEAYATGNKVAFREAPDLHTAAHEAAHVVQQRAGVQLRGGVGEAGDDHERRADAIADRVVSGRSAVDLLAGNIARSGDSAPRAVQRKAGKDDAKILAGQAALKNTDTEIPALEGALLATRLEAVRQGLLSQESFAMGLLLSQAMTKLQPAVAARKPVNKQTQEQAATAAQQLFAALKKETAGEENFRTVQTPGAEGTPTFTTHNPYTEETRTQTYFLGWKTSEISASWLQRLPDLIRQGKWNDAFKGYRTMLNGLDQWVADQLRKKGKGERAAALGNAQEHYAQLRTGLEVIADKHATRLPALFHPDPKTVEKEKAAGRLAADTIPMNVYFWKDAKSGKFHLYDLTTPSRPHEQPIHGPPTAAAMNIFFEEVARYPEGEVRYKLPGGAGGVAPTTGKTKWYEWVGYGALAVGAVGLALLSAGSSVPATLVYATGILAASAGAISTAGHLADSASLGTATTATVVLDVAQIAASFASIGVLGITWKTGGVAAALTNSRWFVPLTTTAAGADVVQLVALSNVTYGELTQIQKGPGSREDKERAMAVLLTQLIVMGGLTALSVRGARDVRALKGKPLEVVDQGGKPVLRLVGDGQNIPSHTSGRLGEPTSSDIKALRKQYNLDSDSEAAAVWHVQHQNSTAGIIAGERDIKKALGIDPNKPGEKMTDLLKIDNRGLQIPIEVKNQKEIHLSGTGNAALSKFENIAKQVPMESISHFEIMCHTNSKLPPNFRVDASGKLSRLVSGSHPPAWQEVKIGGKNVFIKAAGLGEISK